MSHTAILKPGLFNGVFPQQCETQKHVNLKRHLPQKKSFKIFIGDVHRYSAGFYETDISTLNTAIIRISNQLHSHGLQPEHLPECFALVSEYLAREQGFRLHDNQLSAARLMLDGKLAELATGQGKTLATALAALTAGLAGIPVHVITANDYLVQRDANALKKVAAQLGLSTAYITSDIPAAERAAIYQCDIVFVTASELAFDYLRDQQILNTIRSDLHLRLRSHAKSPLALRGLCLALIDEADNVLLDEATTPLVLATESETAHSHTDCAEAFRLIGSLEPLLHYELHNDHQNVMLTESGKQWLASHSEHLTGQWQHPAFRHQTIIQALTARDLLKRDRDYLLNDEGIQPINRTSGRIATGRRWSGGLQSLLEYKENCLNSGAFETLDRTTFQQLFPRYLRLGGTSATLSTARHELYKSYSLETHTLSPQQHNQRHDEAARVFRCEAAQQAAIIKEVTRIHTCLRPILLVTDSVSRSRTLYQRLTDEGLSPQLLNAATEAAEATVISQAGCAGSITIATRMAGRGTDIQLDDTARKSGGLHVIISMFNRSTRLDQQLAGRAARQGDPGSSSILLALTDPQLQQGLGHTLNALITSLSRSQQVTPWLTQSLLKRARQRLERHDRLQRAALIQTERKIARQLQGLQ